MKVMQSNVIPPMKKTTFAELGIPFPLYEAPVSASGDSDYAGTGTCCICGSKDAQCFHLGGSALIVACPKCGTPNGLRVRDKKSFDCRICNTSIPFPTTVAAKKEPKTCYSCLRAGKAAITKDTEFGMVSWEQAFSGVTNGVPGLVQDQFESVVIDADEDWVGVNLPEEVMFELLRTPTYGTWQGECWLFCCRHPMTFLGEWQQTDFEQQAKDADGERLYYSIKGIPEDSWSSLGHGLSVYVFKCNKCGGLRAHSDSD
ncbi:MAG: CbrC family protein [Planctomycetales bacterium]|nr:CbrC family protein [Planctomycetales bacterium]